MTNHRTETPSAPRWHRRLSRRAVVGGFGMLALPMLQACGAAATPTPTLPVKTTDPGKPGQSAVGKASDAVATAVPTKPIGAPPTLTVPAAGTAVGKTTDPGKPGSSAVGAASDVVKPGTPAATVTGAGTPGAAGGTPAATKPAGTPVAATIGTPAAAAAPQLQRVGGTVGVLATWGGEEQANFLAMVKPFEEQTGATVQYEGTRDLNAVLTTRVAGGNPPDVAGLPGPGFMAQAARQGKMIDLGTVLDINQMRQWYAQDWLRLGTVDNKQVGIFIKAALKGLIWYNPAEFQKAGHQVPKTWDELMQLSQKIAGTGTTPWAIGLESAAASGWPGTDWIEDIVLRQAGTEVYDGWADGTVKWSSPQIKQAWQTWGQIVNDPKMVYGGKQYVLATNFQQAADPVYQNPPKAFLHHQASFMSTFIKQNFVHLNAGTGFTAFPFPDMSPQTAGAVESAGDLFGMFKDTPQARELMKWLVSPAAQQIWVQKGGALSPNKAVPTGVYPDPVARDAGVTLQNAKIIRFDASDLMPEAMNNAFWRGILGFVNNPGDLDRILADLDKTQADAYKR